MSATCKICGQRYEREWQLRRCPICWKTFCAECSVTGYGREFCCSPCKEYYKHGEASA